MLKNGSKKKIFDFLYFSRRYGLNCLHGFGEKFTKTIAQARAVKRGGAAAADRGADTAIVFIYSRAADNFNPRASERAASPTSTRDRAGSIGTIIPRADGRYPRILQGMSRVGIRVRGVDVATRRRRRPSTSAHGLATISARGNFNPRASEQRDADR